MFMEAYEKIVKDFMKAITGKKEIAVQENVTQKSDSNELCENENNQGNTVQLPCGE